MSKRRESKTSEFANCFLRAILPTVEGVGDTKLFQGLKTNIRRNILTLLDVMRCVVPSGEYASKTTNEIR